MFADALSDMGEAHCCLVDGNLVVGTSAWFLIIQPESVALPNECWIALESLKGEEVADWRLLSAREIDLPTGLYLPINSSDRSSIIWTSDSWQRPGQILQKCSDLLLKHMEIGESTQNLTDLFNEGQAIPSYTKTDYREGRRVSTSLVEGRSKPSSYTFDYEAQYGRRIVTLGGGLARGLVGMGISLIAPTEARGQKGLPYVTLTSPDGMWLGMLAPLLDSGIDKIDGRPLYIDACKVSWVDEDVALGLVRYDYDYYDPSSRSPDLNLDDSLKQRGSFSDIALGVSALRWNGWSDAEITDVVKKAEYDAWCHLYSAALKKAADLLGSIHRGDSSSWASYSVTNMQRSTRSLCDEVQMLIRVMGDVGGDGGEGLGLGALPELVEAVQELRA
jgi:hypothetical protein